MSAIQKLFMKILPARWAQDMERDSRLWFMRCSSCDFERSIWDMGGIRWKAYGESISLMRCLNCGKVSKHKLYKKQEV